MPKFTKKPVTIEAVRFLSASGTAAIFEGEGPDWLDAALHAPEGEQGSLWLDFRIAPTQTNPLPDRRELVLVVGGFRSERIALPGDWIVRDEKGALHPCEKRIFEQTYVPDDVPIGDDYTGDVDYLSMAAGEMIAAIGTDGRKWTHAFMQSACMDNPLGRALRAFPHTPTDTERADLAGTMLGWFANAIEAGRDAGRAEAIPAPEPVWVDAATLGDIEAAFARGAGANGRLAPCQVSVTEPGQPVQYAEAEVEAVGWIDGVRVVPDAQKAVKIIRAFIDKHHITSPDATVSDGIYAEAPELVGELAQVVGFYRYPDEEEV